MGYSIGDRVDINYKKMGVWLAGSVVAVHGSDDVYQVRLDKPPRMQDMKNWDSTVDLVLTLLDFKAEPEDIKIACSREMSVENMFALLNLFIEFFVLNSLILNQSLLRKDVVVEDSPGEAMAVVVSIPVLDISFDGDVEVYPIAFGVSIGICIALTIITYTSRKKVQTGTLGQDKYGRKAKLLTFEGLRTKIMAVLGQSLFITVMKTLMAAFNCDYTKVPYVLYDQANLRCFNGEHFGYMILAIIAVFPYFLVSAFIVPNLQFVDKSLDIKFDPNFMLLLLQCQFLINWAQVFFRGSYLLILCIFQGLFFLLFSSCWYTKPCLAKRINHWRTMMMFTYCVSCAASILHEVDQRFLPLSWLIILVGWTVSIVFTVLYDLRSYGMLKKKPQKVSPENQDSFFAIGDVGLWDGEPSITPEQMILKLSKTN